LKHIIIVIKLFLTALSTFVGSANDS